MFDFSFRNFVTLSFAKVIFIIAVVLACLWWLFAIISGFGMASIGDSLSPYGSSGGGTVMFGVMALLFGWIPPAIFLILVRLGLEFSVATIRTAQNTSRLVDRSAD
ncbi:MAG TPA: DUF4282 domain-containing protein [Candidatus Ruania gallistercoris]|uniref:DUF4282 domain-containing protein n=1 Tax=Candidatus Ruania gallistercoris TaxID=2838746 RepID=A0A9D2EHD2_9MICO|nr:DUF4282 domain-containing protein [Candidatus Ruania gallistercoris]